jgi:hypothetical protein
MSFKDDFIEYAEKVKLPKEKLWLEYAEFRRIPYVVMGLIDNVHTRIPKEVLYGLCESDKNLYLILWDKAQYFSYTYFRGSNKSIKAIRRNVLKKVKRAYDEEKLKGTL